jgi:hypothetical protein
MSQTGTCTQTGTCMSQNVTDMSQTKAHTSQTGTIVSML